LNIEEARKVLWLKSNPRPLGELLDDGYLTNERLEWAAQRAYSSNLKQAANVILESIKNPIAREKLNAVEVQNQIKALELGITIDKARSTTWPFAPYKGQLMGGLVDSKQLSLKDLGYAIENARDEKVRQAATALSLVRLEQIVKEPAPDAGFVHVVSGGRSYSEREEVRLTFIQGIMSGFLLMLMIVLSVWAIAARSTSNPSGRSLSDIVSTPLGVFTIVIVLFIYILLLWFFLSIPERISKKLDKQIEEHRFGKEGEEQVLQLIIQSLDGNWHVFQNITLPGRNKGDLDLVLVGPPGVWVLEVKNFRGRYRNVGEIWEYKQGKYWKVTIKSPSRQALNNAIRLGNFLNADNINVFVTPAVVWANQESPLTIENPSVAVWQYDRLPDELGNIWQVEKIATVERNKITDKLFKLCERQKEHN
jgi:hypothetical protein